MISLGDLRDLCRNWRLVWTAPRISALFGVHDLFPRATILTPEDTPELDALDRVDVVSQERLTGIRVDAVYDDSKWLDEMWCKAEPELQGENWIARLPRITPRAEAWAAKTGSRLVAKPAELLVQLNDKRTLFGLLRQLGLPRIEGEWISMETHSYSHWRSRMGRRMVLQLSAGNSGSGTAFVDNEEDWEKAGARFGHHAVWIAPNIGDVSLNINAMAMPHASVAAYPSVQLTGFDFLNHTAGMYCGNDFSAAASLPQALLNTVKEQTERIGDAIAATGYSGLFGLDFVIGDADGIPRAVDLNPRWQGSTPLLNQAQRRAGRIPFGAIALLYESGVLEESDAIQACESAGLPIAAAQLRLRNGLPGLQLFSDPPRPGIYNLDGEWRCGGFLLEQLEAEQVLLTGAPPRPGTKVEHAAQLCRLFTLDSVLAPGTFEPTLAARRLVKRICGHAAPDTGRR